MIFASPLRSILFRFSGFCGSEFTDRFVFDVFCVLGSGCRVLLLVSSFPPPPPLSAAPSLVDQAALLWHRTRFLSFWVGFGVVPAYFVLPTPPRSVPGCGLGNRATQLWHRLSASCVIFFFVLSIPLRSDPGVIGVFCLLRLWHRPV